MPEQELAGGMELAALGATEQVERSLADVAAEHVADRDAVQAEYGAEMSKEDRCAQIGEALLTLATTDLEGEKYLAEYLEHTAFPDGTNECLLNFEKERRTDDPAYDVTKEQPRRLAFILRRGLQTKKEFTEVAQGVELADDKLTEAEETEDAWIKISADPEYQSANNTNKIAILLRTEGLPEEIKSRIHAFSKILTIADRIPSDAPIIRQRINQLDLSKGVPDPVAFVRSAIFDSPNSHLKTGVSQATQNAIAKELGISRSQPSIRTGSDVLDTIKCPCPLKLSH